MGSGLLDHEPRWLGPLALATIYLVWGSTYLAIRVMVEDIPPLLGAGLRFLIAGAILYAWVAWRREPAARAVTGRQLIGAAIVGVLLMFGGNGLVTVAEQEVPSGLAALLIATVPLWVILLRATYGRERVPGMTLTSVAVGFVGVALLVLPGDRPEGAPLGLVARSWSRQRSSGRAARSRRRGSSGRRDLLTATAWQMLIGGGAMVAVGLAIGEAADARAGRDLARRLGRLRLPRLRRLDRGLHRLQLAAARTSPSRPSPPTPSSTRSLRSSSAGRS